jgi:hypothetical protein
MQSSAKEGTGLMPPRSGRNAATQLVAGLILGTIRGGNGSINGMAEFVSCELATTSGSLSAYGTGGNIKAASKFWIHTTFVGNGLGPSRPDITQRACQSARKSK